MTTMKPCYKCHSTDHLHIEAREDWITTLHDEHQYCIPANLSKTRLLEAIRMGRSMLLELYKMVEDDDK